MAKRGASVTRGIELATLTYGPSTSDMKRFRPSTMPKTTPSTAPITKPRMASSIVTAICCHSGPCAVPCVTQVTSCAQMPEGCPQKNGSITGSLAPGSFQCTPSSQPPMITTINSTRRTLTRMRLRRRAAEYDFTSLLSRAVMVCSLTSLLCTLIANKYLLSQIFPDVLVQLDETWLEADFLPLAWARQVDAVDALDGAWPSREDAHAVGQGDSLFQVMGDADHRRLAGRPHLKQF